MAPAVGEKIASTPGFTVDSETYATLRTMVEAKQQQLKDLQVLMMQEQGYLKKLRDDQVKERQQVEQELRIRRQDFEKELSGERYRLTEVQRNLEQVARDIEEQKKELTILSANAEGIRAERDQTVNERIAMEQQRIRAAELHQQAEASLHQLHAAQAQFEVVQKETENLRSKVEQQDRLNQATQEELEKREQSVKLDLDQVKALRAELDPKLEQLSIREAQVKEQLIRVESLQKEGAEQKTELAQARADLEGVGQKLDAEKIRLNEWELRLKQLQSNLYIKIQLAKSKGIEIEDPPKD